MNPILNSIDPNTIIAVFVPIISPLITAGLKWFLPRIPSWTIPIICTALGTLSGYIGQLSLGGDLSVFAMAGLGIAGIGVRELLDQLKKVSQPVK